MTASQTADDVVVGGAPAASSAQADQPAVPSSGLAGGGSGARIAAPPTPKHGTYATYQREKRNGVETCQDCRRAASEYMKRLRSKGGRTAERGRAENAARSRAYARLAALHPSQYLSLMQEEMSKAGWRYPA